MKRKKLTSFKNSGFYFDDCAICGAMANAEEQGRNPSFDELNKAFDLQNSKQKSKKRTSHKKSN